MKNLLFLFPFLFLIGCQSTNSVDNDEQKTTLVNESTLSLDDSVDVIKAVVENPYPECSNNNSDVKKVRIANLGQKRSKRLYLEGGALCQRLDY